MVPAALVILLVGAGTGYVAQSIIGLVAAQVGYFGFALAMAQRSATVST